MAILLFSPTRISEYLQRARQTYIQLNFVHCLAISVPECLQRAGQTYTQFILRLVVHFYTASDPQQMLYC